MQNNGGQVLVKELLESASASYSQRDVIRATYPYVLYGVKYIDLVSLCAFCRPGLNGRTCPCLSFSSRSSAGVRTPSPASRYGEHALTWVVRPMFCMG